MDQFFQINVGQIVQIIIILTGGILALQTMKNEIRYHGDRLIKIENKMEDLEKVVVQIARQDERMNAMDQRMLAQGKRIDSKLLSRKVKEEENNGPS